MDTLQNLLTIAATALEYFFFGYLAVLFLVYSFEQQSVENQQRFTNLANQGLTATPQAAVGNVAHASALEPQRSEPILATAG